jgi:hypothetical protein
MAPGFQNRTYGQQPVGQLKVQQAVAQFVSEVAPRPFSAKNKKQLSPIVTLDDKVYNCFYYLFFNCGELAIIKIEGTICGFKLELF